MHYPLQSRSIGSLDDLAPGNTAIGGFVAAHAYSNKKAGLNPAFSRYS
jgi:hypothetical protein